MIIDQLANARLYRGLHPRLAAAFDFLERGDLPALPLGKTVIDGEHIYALVQEHIPKPLAAGKYEAHERYWDVQCVVSGIERMGWSHISRMAVTQPYDAARDVSFFEGAGDLLLVPAGSFTVFAPDDVHMPGIAVDDTHEMLVRKIVVKVEAWE